MLKNVSKIRFTSELEELKEVLSKVTSGDIVVSLKRVTQGPDGTYSKNTEQTSTISMANTLININADDKLLYVHIKSADKPGLKRVVFWHDTVLARATECFKQSKPLDLFLVVDVIRSQLEKNVVYNFSVNSPYFIWLEDETLRLCFPIDRAWFEKVETTLEEIEYEMEQMDEYNDDDDEDGWMNNEETEDIIGYRDTY